MQKYIFFWPHYCSSSWRWALDLRSILFKATFTLTSVMWGKYACEIYTGIVRETFVKCIFISKWTFRPGIKYLLTTKVGLLSKCTEFCSINLIWIESFYTQCYTCCRGLWAGENYTLWFHWTTYSTNGKCANHYPSLVSNFCLLV